MLSNMALSRKENSSDLLSNPVCLPDFFLAHGDFKPEAIMKKNILYVLLVLGAFLIAASNSIPSLGLGHTTYENSPQFL